MKKVLAPPQHNSPPPAAGRPQQPSQQPSVPSQLPPLAFAASSSPVPPQQQSFRQSPTVSDTFAPQQGQSSPQYPSYSQPSDSDFSSGQRIASSQLQPQPSPQTAHLQQQQQQQPPSPLPPISTGFQSPPPLLGTQYGLVPQQQPTPPPAEPSLFAGDLPPLRPVFGVSLGDLYRRDGSAVPSIVYQCLQAVDLYGLDVVGIYRLSGTSSHVGRIRAIFDHGRFLNAFSASITSLVLYFNYPNS